jgi:2-oxoglutarate dehydrogenase complex dehydrogenase (E1) component-like enzyme
MIDTFRSIGHHFAKMDPLYLEQNMDAFGRLPQEAISPAEFGYKEE